MDYQTFSTKAVACVTKKHPATIRNRARALGIIPGDRGRYSLEQVRLIMNYQRKKAKKPQRESIEAETRRLLESIAKINEQSAVTTM